MLATVCVPSCTSRFSNSYAAAKNGSCCWIARSENARALICDIAIEVFTSCANSVRPMIPAAVSSTATDDTATKTYQPVSLRASAEKASMGAEGVAGSPDRTDQLRFEVRVDLGAQIRDVRFDRARTDVAIAAPDEIQQLVAREHALGVTHERQQQRVLARRCSRRGRRSAECRRATSSDISKGLGM